ncbi:uncharacterized protein LOC128895363 isoform X1 [Hylaeus anthracinus]|uniref:uncharacterized protein LOC128895363 isoform X1 n=1 Tax=Hylaeus anthracinus TaxID=313031 RepID=UPI0023B9C6C3|nr:uncharacterized protein LOC128895363 isoform X1 [Hylaeus anthracinus]
MRDIAAWLPTTAAAGPLIIGIPTQFVLLSMRDFSLAESLLVQRRSSLPDAPEACSPTSIRFFSDLGSPIDPRILLDPTAACFTSGPPKRRLRRSILEAFSNDPGNCARSKHLDSHNRRWIRAYRFLLYRPAAYDRSRVPSQPGIVSMWKLHTLHRSTV